MKIIFAHETTGQVNLGGFALKWEDNFDGAANSPPAAHWFNFDGWEDPNDQYRDAIYDHGDAYLDGAGNLRMRIRYDGGNLYLPWIQTYDWPVSQDQWSMFDQGRGTFFIVRARFSDWTAGGPWWAFWLFAPENTYDGDLTNGVEIDIGEVLASQGVRGSWLEQFPNGALNAVNVAVHVGGTLGGRSEFVQLDQYGIDIRDGQFHEIALYWDGTILQWWVDGILIWTITENVPTGGRHALMLSMEYDKWDGANNTDPWDQRELVEDHAADLPQYVDIDSVSVYERIEEVTPTEGIPVILDTDLSGDIDDVAALAALCRLMQLSYCDIEAIGSCVWHGRAVGAISIICDYYGLSNIPIAKQSIGVNSINSTNDKGYASYLTDNFTPTQNSNTAVSSTSLYRQKLAAAEDASIVFITIGPLHNIKQLLDSPADGWSPLTGEALFNLKVGRVHIMGGQYPTSGGSPEYNFSASGTGVAADVVARITVPIYFNGFEVGFSSNGWGFGTQLQSQPASNPVAEAYKYFFLNPPSWINGGVPGPIIDYSTWDTIATITAVRGYSDFSLVSTGYNNIAANGGNTWESSPDGTDFYLVESLAAETFISDVLAPLVLPDHTWDNQYSPPAADGDWVVRTVSANNAPATTVGFHQTEYAPVSGGPYYAYGVDDYPDDCELLLIGDGTTLDMPVRLPKRVKRLHIRGLRFDLDWSKGYLTNKNDSSGTYTVAREKTPFHCNFTHSLVIEGCSVKCNGLAIDIVQLPNAQGDATDHATRDVYVLNSMFSGMGGVGPGFHGDFFHSADNTCRDLYIENVHNTTSYNFITGYAIGGVSWARQVRMRGVSAITGPVGPDGGSASNNFAMPGMDNPAIISDVYHPWGGYTGGGEGHPNIRNSNPHSQDDLCPDHAIGDKYISPFNIGA